MEKKQNVFVAYGIISGIVVIIFTLGLYLGGIEWFMNPIAFVVYVLPIVIAVLASVKQKKLQGGYLSFGEALKGSFLVFVITGLLSSIFIYILFNYIDVPFRDALSQKSAEISRQMMERFGMKEDDIDRATDDILSGRAYSVRSMAINFAVYCVIYFIVSLIIAAIVKRKKPEFPQSQF